MSCKLIMYMCFVDIKFFFYFLFFFFVFYFFLFDQLLNERVSGPGEVSLSGWFFFPHHAQMS